MLETGVRSAPTSQPRQQQHSSKANPVDHVPKSRVAMPDAERPADIGPSDSTTNLIKRQLLAAGFVDVEEKGWQSSSSTAGICHRIAGMGRCLKSWCLGFLGVRWNCDSSLNTASQLHTIGDEKGPSPIRYIIYSFLPHLLPGCH